MTKNDLAADLGFTWDRSAVPRNVTGDDVRRALWRFGKTLPGYVWDAAVLEGNRSPTPRYRPCLKASRWAARSLATNGRS